MTVLDGGSGPLGDNDDDDDDGQVVPCTKHPWKSHVCGACRGSLFAKL